MPSLCLWIVTLMLALLLAGFFAAIFYIATADLKIVVDTDELWDESGSRPHRRF